MPITPGSVTTSNYASPAFSSGAWRTTFNVTVSGGQNALVVCVGGLNRLPSSVTYNGSAMTLAVSQGDNFAHVYTLANPTVGTLPVEVVFNSGLVWFVAAQPLAGADTAALVRTTTQNAGFGTSRSGTLTTVVDDYVVGVVSVESAGASITTSQTLLSSGSGNNGIDNTSAAAAATTATTTSTALGFTHPSAWSYAAFAVIAPSGGGGASSLGNAGINCGLFS
jgi:hypothetical protein